jgi:hypothetical protein
MATIPVATNATTTSRAAIPITTTFRTNSRCYYNTSTAEALIDDLASVSAAAVLLSQ